MFSKLSGHQIFSIGKDMSVNDKLNINKMSYYLTIVLT